MKDIIECPHCHKRVISLADGVCPACRNNTQQASVTASEEDAESAREKAWDSYQKTLSPSSDEYMRLSLAEVQLFDWLRTRGVARLLANEGADHVSAGRILDELLPRYAKAIKRLQKKYGNDAEGRGASLIEHAKTRAASWELLAEALQENDKEKLQRHLELWRETEDPTSRDAPEQKAAPQMREFQQALVTFTPRLVATPTIVIANVLVFAVMVVSGVHFFSPDAHDVANWGANYGPRTMNGQWWRLATCMFLHFGILHLAFNMWVLWDLGRIVERLVGNVGFVVLYFVSGVAGSVASLAAHPTVVSAGASGAIFGVAGALLGLIVLRRDTIPVAVLKELWGSMIAFLLFNLVFGISIPAIDMAAHFGGFVAGFGCGVIMSQPLSITMVARRKYRNAIALVVGVVALLPITATLTDAPPDAVGEVQRFMEMEDRVLEIYNSGAVQVQRGEVSADAFADAIERDVLPPWIEARERIVPLLEAKFHNRDYLSRLVEYMLLREEHWQLQIEALREQDPAKAARANRMTTKATKMAKDL